MRYFLQFCLTLFIFLVLSGCGASNNSASVPTPTRAQAQNQAAGIWTGTLTSARYGTLDISSVIGNNGQAFFFAAEGPVYSGQLSISGSDISGSLTAYASAGTTFPDGEFIVPTSVSATVKAQTSLSGSYRGGGDSGTFSLTYSSDSAGPASISWVSGSWAGAPQEYGPGSGRGTALSISSNGGIGGTDISTGCQFAGQINAINPNLNAYSVTLSISSCLAGGSNQNYTGLAYLSAVANPNDTLTVAISNANSAYIFVFTI
jgi:hypothetical protein